MNPETLSVGIDVSRDELVIAYADDLRPVQHVANTAAAIQRWLKSLPAGARIGLEATGAYHRLVAELAVVAGHVVYVLNPREVAHYLHSLRSRGKTDVLDACGIARFVLNETGQCHPYVPPTALQRDIATLVQRRHQVMKNRTALRLSFSGISDCTKAVNQLLAAFDRLLADIDARLQALVRQDERLAAGRARLATISGIGPLVSTALAVRFNRINYANSDALVAALGLDPRPRESGQFKGRRHLSKRGNPEERRLICMAAMCACRTAVWRPILEKLLAKGHPRTAAYCIIARKLLRIALAVWKSGQPYQPQLVGQTGQRL
jgi:transposase